MCIRYIVNCTHVYCVCMCWFIIPLLAFNVPTVATFCSLFVIAPSPPTATIHPMLPTEEGSLFEFPRPMLTPTPTFFSFCFVMRQCFLRGVFLVFLENLGESGSGTVAVAGQQNTFETLYMILVCTNKLDLTCLQLHHSYEAHVCLNQSGSLCALSVSSCSRDLLLFVPLSAY